jgi:hypothetical protein
MQKFLAEMWKFALVALYLFLFFGAFATYRRLILSQYQINYLHYGYSLIEALVLGKVILLGDVFRLGDRFHGKPLIVPTLYRTLIFSLLVLAFTLLEHFVEGFIHGQSVAAVLGEIAAKGGADIAAKILVMFIAFIPMFAIWEISNLFEKGKLFELFFEHGGKEAAELSEMTKAASLRQG